MKSLYENILSSTNAGRESIIKAIKAWLRGVRMIENYTINDKFEIDVDGNVSLSNCGLVELPPFIQFGVVKGSFYCYNNKLTSLRGIPKKVGINFDCSDNNLISLKGSPIEVGGSFDCTGNKLKSLKGAPIKAGAFKCGNNTTQFTKDDVKKVCKVEDDIYV